MGVTIRVYDVGDSEEGQHEFWERLDNSNISVMAGIELRADGRRVGRVVEGAGVHDDRRLRDRGGSRTTSATCCARACSSIKVWAIGSEMNGVWNNWLGPAGGQECPRSSSASSATTSPSSTRRSTTSAPSSSTARAAAPFPPPPPARPPPDRAAPPPAVWEAAPPSSPVPLPGKFGNSLTDACGTAGAPADCAPKTSLPTESSSPPSTATTPTPVEGVVPIGQLRGDRGRRTPGRSSTSAAWGALELPAVGRDHRGPRNI